MAAASQWHLLAKQRSDQSSPALLLQQRQWTNTVPQKHPHDRLPFPGVSMMFDSAEENGARGGWRVEIPSKNSVSL